MQPPDVVVLEVREGEQAALAAGELMHKGFFVHVRAIRQTRIGAVKIVRLDLRQQEPHCLLRSCGGPQLVLLRNSRLIPRHSDQDRGSDDHDYSQRVFHHCASRTRAGSRSGAGKAMTTSDRTRVPGIRNANRIARMLEASGRVPHISPSRAVGMASDGMGWAGGMSSRDQTVIEPLS